MKNRIKIRSLAQNFDLLLKTSSKASLRNASTILANMKSSLVERLQHDEDLVQQQHNYREVQ